MLGLRKKGQTLCTTTSFATENHHFATPCANQSASICPACSCSLRGTLKQGRALALGGSQGHLIRKSIPQPPLGWERRCLRSVLGYCKLPQYCSSGDFSPSRLQDDTADNHSALTTLLMSLVWVRLKTGIIKSSCIFHGPRGLSQAS